MKYYFDTSSLVKIYHRESGTTDVLNIYNNSENQIQISELGRVEFISTIIGEDAWRHFKGGKHKGAFSVYLFETLSIGIAANIGYVRNLPEKILYEKMIKFKQEPNFLNNTGPGANVKSKLRGRLEFAQSFFSK